MRKSAFQKLIRSVKHLERDWARYKKQFPEDTWGFRYRIIVESYCYRDKKIVFRTVFNIPFINWVFLPNKTYRQLRRYVKIDRLLRTSLKKRKPQKRHPDKTYQTSP